MFLCEKSSLILQGNIIYGGKNILQMNKTDGVSFMCFFVFAISLCNVKLNSTHKHRHCDTVCFLKKGEEKKEEVGFFFFFDCLASVSFLAMATRKCFRAKDCSWPWTGSGTKACGTSLCSSHCGGRSSRDPKHSLQVRARDGAEVASLWRGVTSDKGTTNCETSCVVVVVL